MKKIMAKLGVHDKDSAYKLIIQFVKFGIVGVSNTAISLAVYYAFVYIAPSLYLWGNFAGWIISVLNAFYWGNKFVFNSSDNTAKSVLKRLLKSYLTYGATFLLSQALLLLLVDFLNMSEWIAPLLILILTIPLNFIINKFWTFKDKKD